MSRECRQRLARFGVGIEMQVIVHQRRANGVARLDPGRLQRKIERRARDLPEIRVFLHQSAQPRVFELFEAPQLGDKFAFTGPKFFGFGPHRLRLVKCAVSVKNQRTNHGRSSHRLELARSKAPPLRDGAQRISSRVINGLQSYALHLLRLIRAPTGAMPIMPDVTGLGSFSGTPCTLLTLSGLSFTVREVFFSSDHTRTMSPLDAASQQLISRLHASGRKAALAITGGGSGAIGELLRVPGGSRLLIEAQVPYDEMALATFLGFAPVQACSSETAIAMAQSARARAARLMPAGTDLVGLGATAALVSDRPRRGEHRFHIAFANAAGIAHCTCVMAKGRRDRAAEEDLVSRA